MSFSDTASQWSQMWQSLFGGQQLDLNDPNAISQARAKFALIGKTDEFDKQVTDWQAQAAALNPAAPPPPPDLSDQAVMLARLVARRRAVMGQGYESTFLSGPLGDTSTIPPGGG